jgi:2-phospho-L-lactate guanylyltransferase
MVFALVPVKNLLVGKSRLSNVLSFYQRERLSVLMLQEVLRVLHSSKRFNMICVITSDLKIAGIAENLETKVILENQQTSENHSIEYATEVCCSLGAESLLILPSDIPLITIKDIDSILAGRQKTQEITICPSKEGTGTNALYKIPPDVIPPRFGPNSFRCHLEEAKAKKINYEIRRLNRVAFDIDTPEDLLKLMMWRGNSTIHSELQEIITYEPKDFQIIQVSRD